MSARPKFFVSRYKRSEERNRALAARLRRLGVVKIVETRSSGWLYQWVIDPEIYSMNKKQISHMELVLNLCKPGVNIVAGLTNQKAHCIHMALGIAGETGELVDIVKKWAMYDKPLEVDKVIEEMGDIEFYLEGLRQGLGISRNDVIQANIQKLSKRYSSGSYSDEEALARADKKGE